MVTPMGPVVTSTKITMQWTVYMILASDGSLYTGITTDLARRFAEHGGGGRKGKGDGQSKKGAKYFHASRRPTRVVYEEPSDGRASASRREAAIKKLSRQEKLSLCESFQKHQGK